MRHILLQILVAPAAAAMIILFARPILGKRAGWIACITLSYTTVLLCVAGLKIQAGEILQEYYPLGPEVTLNLLADGLSLPIAIVINLICLVLAFYSIPYVDHRIEVIYGDVDRRTWLVYYTRFFFFYLFFPAGFMGVCFSTNLMALYFFLELLTIIPLYFIMAQFGYSDYISRYRVALLCLFWGVAGATLFLIGILMAHNQTGSFEIRAMKGLAENGTAFWIALLILLGLATKLAIVPFHVWMPWVHAEHPTCIAGLLAVYANIAVYVAVRVLFIPLHDVLAVFIIPILLLAFITMVYGALLTLAQTDAKRFCACSTISQISYSVFGVGALTVLGMEGGVFYFLSHILGKAVLFSTAGILVYTTGVRDMRQMGGLWSKMPLTGVLWICAALILSALPPTSGFVGKWMLFGGAFQSMQGHPLGILMVVLAVISTILTLVYTFLAGIRIFFGPLKPGLSQGHLSDPPLGMTLPLFGLSAVAFFLGVYPKPFLSLMHTVIGIS